MLSISRTVQQRILDDPERGLGGARKAVQKTKPLGLSFTEEFQREAVAMLLDGHSAPAVAERFGVVQPRSSVRCGPNRAVRGTRNERD